ncbi:DUF1697 domain-containing protein [Streptomyces sp. SID5785]|uniref:DUF1697 domain-containing protein n=1 Tax=Streptomyces sp. SID5785 TaxID=2690309 RepID=UPI00136112B6|nr:DUF1697 domain-containing protein [Streptomyces sp. SID5785]MZD08110.1 DUF1697 domain-containing protein [Streptomyces sp. SID5785]MZD10150.1 DUF1697 domain-containing protein [Streptomyces sp. SID5785]
MAITRYAALLRGINVGGSVKAKKVPMARLRPLIEGLGHTGVQTYLQSGNAAFSSAARDEDALARELEAAVAAEFGFPVDIVVRDHAYLAAVRDACPFPAAELEGRQLHVTYFSEPVTPDRFAAVDAAAYAPEDYRLGDRVLYLYAPDGLGTSKLGARLAAPALTKGLIATSRNWNTVSKLVELTEQA